MIFEKILHHAHLSNETPITDGVVIEFLADVEGADAGRRVDDVRVTMFVVSADTTVGGEAIFIMLGLASMEIGFTGDWGVFEIVTIDSLCIIAACCSMVLGGRLGTIRSGKTVVGAVPYLNGGESFSSCFSHPLPVDPTNVTLLTLDGDVGALGTSVSELPDAEIDCGTPKNPSSWEL